MMRISREMLQYAQQDNNEYKLQVLVRSLFQRKYPQTVDLVIEAFRSPNTSDKEIYVTLLREFDDPRAMSALIDFVSATSDADDDDQAGLLVQVIDALRHARVERAAPILLLRLHDREDRVRGAIIDFLVELEIKSAGSSFVLGLERETDPDNLRALVNALAEWNCVGALPPFRRLMGGDLAHDNELLHKALSDAIKALTGKPG